EAMCFGPNLGDSVTIQLPEGGIKRSAVVPDPEEPAPAASLAYFGASGPTTMDAFGNWLSGGWFGKRQLRAWFLELADRLTAVEVEGQHAYVLAEDADELAWTKPTGTVRLLPGFDQYVMGPGTGDAHVVPAARRAAVS